MQYYIRLIQKTGPSWQQSNMKEITEDEYAKLFGTYIKPKKVAE